MQKRKLLAFKSSILSFYKSKWWWPIRHFCSFGRHLHITSYILDYYLNNCKLPSLEHSLWMLSLHTRKNNVYVRIHLHTGSVFSVPRGSEEICPFSGSFGDPHLPHTLTPHHLQVNSKPKHLSFRHSSPQQKWPLGTAARIKGKACQAGENGFSVLTGQWNLHSPHLS